MEAELAKMQEKLLIGGVTIQDRTTQQERELEVKRAKLAEERLKERYFFRFCLIFIKTLQGNFVKITTAGRAGRKCSRELQRSSARSWCKNKKVEEALQQTSKH